MSGMQLLLSMSVVLTAFQYSSASNILIVPTYSDGSLFRVTTKMARQLAQRGHNVSLVVASTDYSHVDDRRDLAGITKHAYATTSLLNGVKVTRFTEAALGNRLGFVETAACDLRIARACSDLFDDLAFLKGLEETTVDLVIASELSLCGALLAIYLNRPFVLHSASARIAPVSNAALFYIPNNLAYTPCLGSGLSDKMNFLERVFNFGYFFARHVTYSMALAKFDEVKRRKNIRPDLGIRDVQAEAELYLYNTDIASSYPRPLMPNVVLLGAGYLIEPVEPLNKELEHFVESSGDDGIVIFSLGTYLEMTSSHFRRFAEALDRIPQKVIVKYDGERRPQYLRNSTKYTFLNWIPQNDLLGHPKTKALIYHGGVNGVHEAIHHAVPVVGIPLFYDQIDNVQFLADRGMAIVLAIRTLSSADLYEAITEVTTDPTYKENAVRLSRIQRDRPLSHEETLIFWIEYIIRHGGKHLRSQAVNLNVFQYYLVDVVALVLATLAILMFALVKVCYSCCGRVSHKKTMKRD